MAALSEGATRFRRWRPGPARLLLAVLAALAAYAAAFALMPAGPSPIRTGPAAASDAADTPRGDAELYRSIARRVAGGEDYYEAAAAEHRLGSYPLRPFVNVRPPTLAHLHARLGETGAAILLDGLVVAALLLLAGLFGAGLPARRPWPVALAVIGLVPTLLPVSAVWHEPWAGVLIVLSLACRRPGRYAASVALALTAVAIRDLALPFLAVMAVLALREGHRREAAAWCGAIVLALALLAVHAALVASVTRPGDLASQGWVSVAGWPFLVHLIRACGILAAFPPAVASLVIPLCLLGWIAWDDPFAERAALLLVGYGGAFLVLGRPENWYWGLLVSPLLLVGLAFVPAALADLTRAASSGQSPTTSRSPS